MLWAAFTVALLERAFLAAAGWMFALSALSWVGLIHAYTLTPGGLVSHFGWGASPVFAVSYLLVALFCAGMHWRRGTSSS